MPLKARRLGAWVVEVSLVAASAVVPFQLGQLADARFAGEPVPLNSMLKAINGTIAQTLAIPVPNQQKVAPLTNLLWSGAALAPVVLAGSQLYLLAKTGKTAPKAWFAVQVTTATGAAPGLARVALREGIGRWGLPIATAYLVWVWSGALPDLGILTGLIGLMLIGAGVTPQFDRQRRALHDRLAGTYVLDAAAPWQPRRESPQRLQRLPAIEITVDGSDGWADEDGAIAAIVLKPNRFWRQQGMWHWLRHRPGVVLLTFSLTALGLTLGTFISTQVYIQSQTNWRERHQQRDQVFLSLVNKLTTAASPAEQRAAVLALAAIDDSRATPLLADLLAQESNPVLLSALEQALVSRGPQSLPYLQKLNQAVRTELTSLRRSHQPAYRTLVLRQRATQQAVAKILTLYSGQIPPLDLSRIDLAQATVSVAPFTLVLDQVDLSGIKLRGALLAGASLQSSRLYSPGKDDRWGTHDDWIADLSGAELKTANLTGALLSRVLLDRANLTGAVLNRANLSSARLSQTNLSGASLIEANLQQSMLERASLTGANLGNANLAFADLRSALLGQVKAVGAQFQSANLRQTDWQQADLSFADFREAHLEEANLSAAQLNNANLQNAQLQNANLQEADLRNADLRGADLEGANLQGALFVSAAPADSDRFIVVKPTFAPTHLLMQVDFSRVRNLSADQIDYICFQGGLHPDCQ
jgi:uncharacterized protein YjbI with pentapeptide repeats/uncharacterized RDD family membrane protein YckC